MYVNDYVYATHPEDWDTTVWEYAHVSDFNNNWMYMGLDEWTLSRRSDFSDNAWNVDYDGGVDTVNVYSLAFKGAVRPVFYLCSSVLYSEGDGTRENPYRIEI